MVALWWWGSHFLLRRRDPRSWRFGRRGMSNPGLRSRSLPDLWWWRFGFLLRRRGRLHFGSRFRGGRRLAKGGRHWGRLWLGDFSRGCFYLRSRFRRYLIRRLMRRRRARFWRFLVRRLMRRRVRGWCHQVRWPAMRSRLGRSLGLLLLRRRYVEIRRRRWPWNVQIRRGPFRRTRRALRNISARQLF